MSVSHETTEDRERAEARERMEAMGSLIAAVAHEVRNPLFAISATVDAFVARFGERPEYGQHVAALRREVDRLARFMQGLLDYARPDRLTLEQRHLMPCIDRAVQDCEVPREERGVRIVVRARDNLPAVALDELQIAQAFRNLIENAIQHTPRYSTILIEAECVLRDGEPWVSCSVRDSGKGIADADAALIFEPFFTRRAGGTGLGLAIVKRIVISHGGTVSASNRSSGGLEITVELPCAAKLA